MKNEVGNPAKNCLACANFFGQGEPTLLSHHPNFAATPPFPTKPNRVIIGSSLFIIVASCQFDLFHHLLYTKSSIMAMKLRLSPNAYYERTSINLLMLDLNKHVATQDYAMIKGRNKVSKRGVRMKY